MSVDHRRPHALVAEELLDGPDVVAADQEVGGEGVTQGVAGRRLDDPRLLHGFPEDPLDSPLVEVVPAVGSAPRIGRALRRGEDVLPAPTRRRPGNTAATVEDMGVDHRRPDALVAEELLDGPDVVAAHQEVGGEGVTQGVAGRRLDDPRLLHRLPEGPLDSPLVEVVPAVGSAPRVGRALRRGKDVLPAPLGVGPWIFPRQRVGEVNPAVPFPQVLLVELLHALQVLLKSRLEASRQHGHPVLRPTDAKGLPDTVEKLGLSRSSNSSGWT